MFKSFAGLKLEKHPHVRSLRVSWKEGVAASIMLNITDYYLIPFGLVLGATPFHIGLLVAIPQLAGSLAQFFSVHLVKFLGSRLKFLVPGAALQALSLLPLAAFPFFEFPFRVEIFIFFIVLFRTFGNLIGTVWGSLISDYLSSEERGKYLGWRSQIAGFSGIGGILLGGFLLSAFKNISTDFAFSLLMLITSGSRFLSAYLMSRLEDIPLQHKEETDFTFVQFLARFKESNFVKFVLYAASITFATHMASPYFSVYMLEELKFGYLNYMAVHLAAVLAGLIAFPIWGRHADRVGNAKVLKLTSFFIPVVPFLWIFTGRFEFLFLIEMLAGFVWGGFNLCSVNFIFDAVMPEKRVRCLSYFNFINGIAIFGGATLGGYLATSLPMIRDSRLCTLFLISAILRFLAHFLLSKNFREVRVSAESVSSLDLFFSVIGLKPLQGRSREWNIWPTGK